MRGIMVDIQSATAEIGRGKKIEERKKPQDQNIMPASATQGGHNDIGILRGSERSDFDPCGLSKQPVTHAQRLSTTTRCVVLLFRFGRTG